MLDGGGGSEWVGVRLGVSQEVSQEVSTGGNNDPILEI